MCVLVGLIRLSGYFSRMFVIVVRVMGLIRLSLGRVFSERILNRAYDFEPGFFWPGTTSTRYLFMGRNQMYFICNCLST